MQSTQGEEEKKQEKSIMASSVLPENVGNLMQRVHPPLYQFLVQSGPQGDRATPRLADMVESLRDSLKKIKAVLTHSSLNMENWPQDVVEITKEITAAQSKLTPLIKVDSAAVLDKLNETLKQTLVDCTYRVLSLVSVDEEVFTNLMLKELQIVIHVPNLTIEFLHQSSVFWKEVVTACTSETMWEGVPRHLSFISRNWKGERPRGQAQMVKNLDHHGCELIRTSNFLVKPVVPWKNWRRVDTQSTKKLKRSLVSLKRFNDIIVKQCNLQQQKDTSIIQCIVDDFWSRVHAEGADVCLVLSDFETSMFSTKGPSFRAAMAIAEAENMEQQKKALILANEANVDSVLTQEIISCTVSFAEAQASAQVTKRIRLVRRLWQVRVPSVSIWTDLMRRSLHNIRETMQVRATLKAVAEAQGDEDLDFLRRATHTVRLLVTSNRDGSLVVHQAQIDPDHIGVDGKRSCLSVLDHMMRVLGSSTSTSSAVADSLLVRFSSMTNRFLHSNNDGGMLSFEPEAHTITVRFVDALKQANFKKAAALFLRLPRIRRKVSAEVDMLEALPITGTSSIGWKQLTVILNEASIGLTLKESAASLTKVIQQPGIYLLEGKTWSVHGGCILAGPNVPMVNAMEAKLQESKQPESVWVAFPLPKSQQQKWVSTSGTAANGARHLVMMTGAVLPQIMAPFPGFSNGLDRPSHLAMRVMLGERKKLFVFEARLVSSLNECEKFLLARIHNEGELPVLHKLRGFDKQELKPHELVNLGCDLEEKLRIYSPAMYERAM
jgi:hypothetical protein